MGESRSRLRSGELAAAAGVNVQTLRYYERRGLLGQPDRSPGGHRLYAPEALTTVRVIKAAQRLGFSLVEVADLLQVSRVGRRRRGNTGLRARAVVKLAEVDAKLAELTGVREVLRAALDAGCEDLLLCAEIPDCPVPFTNRNAWTVAVGRSQALASP
jgi:DNA-binding transcriptional MerR regulator